METLKAAWQWVADLHASLVLLIAASPTAALWSGVLLIIAAAVVF